jgi:uncharacterized YkwD family protein/spore coat assembly protein SafA
MLLMRVFPQKFFSLFFNLKKRGGGEMKLKKIASAMVIATLLTLTAFAQTVYTVKSGDTSWKIAQRYQVGLSELRAANPHIPDLSKIYPGQKMNIPSPSSYSALENQVVTLVNKERSRRGLMLLSTNWQLARVARYKSQDMVNKNYFSHTSPTYGSPFRMMENFGIKFTAAGENIAMGQQTPQAVMNAWMNSPGHRSNILSSVYNQIGVGVAKKSNGVLIWTQQFIKAS